MSDLSDQFAAKLGINDFLLQQFESNRTLADNLKLESFLKSYQKFSLESFDQFIGPDEKENARLRRVVEKLEEDNDDLREEVSELETQLDDASVEERAPEFDLLIDQSKYDYFMENFKQLKLEDLEYLIETNRV